MRIFNTKRFEETGEVAIIGATQAEIVAEAGKYAHAAIIVENQSGLEKITYAQIKWIKGVLLAQMAVLTGESVGYWEDTLKLKVMPDKFARVMTKTESAEIVHLPSIAILTKGEAGEFITNSVAYLRDEQEILKGKRFGDTFHWVQLPDPDLRS